VSTFVDTRKIPLVGQPTIDRGHLELADHVNGLYDRWVGGAPPGSMVDALRAFLTRAGCHFREEEALLAAAGFAGLDRHRAVHADLARNLTALVDRAEAVASGAADGAGTTESGTMVDLFSAADTLIYEHEILEDQDFRAVFVGPGRGCDLEAGPLLAWRRSQSTGLLETDAHHRRLVVLLNQLHHLVCLGVSPREVDDLLHVFFHHADVHLRAESRRPCTPGAPSPRAAEAQRMALDAIVAGYRAGTGGRPDLALRDWLRTHLETTGDRESAGSKA